ncbi:hypothetical protein H8K90_10135 [Winogradskyella echinorum]|uniref:Uncharacterized protein n=1 Tax=Winogradskyella echinorum TaxID=538189 RepID=A0ABR6Y1X5_9FLAO|nr:hypothetical protein [Winogradskyella echinorum]MBC3846737.1 hypothetical protein [Winogradskyella echinorum]MBC5751085.1 hypothetical protein [Winogradskyella echinorum]
MKEFFIKLNNFFRNLLLSDVDKPYDRPLPYHRKFGSVERQKNDLKQKRAQEQREQSRGF